MIVAVLHQSGPTPAIGGIVRPIMLLLGSIMHFLVLADPHRWPRLLQEQSKPPKPGGYKDSSADVAFNLKEYGVEVALPQSSPDPISDEGWCE